MKRTSIELPFSLSKIDGAGLLQSHLTAWVCLFHFVSLAFYVFVSSPAHIMSVFLLFFLNIIYGHDVCNNRSYWCDLFFFF